MVDFIDRSTEPPNKEVQMYNDLTVVPEYLEGDEKTLLRFDYRPKPTKADIDNGYIKRYFAKQSNVKDGDIIEISQKHFNDLVNAPLYSTAEIIWRIKGKLDSIPNPNEGGSERLYMGVLDSNTEAINDGDDQLPGLHLKLTDPLEFYQGV